MNDFCCRKGSILRTLKTNCVFLSGVRIAVMEAISLLPRLAIMAPIIPIPKQIPPNRYLCHVASSMTGSTEVA